MTSFNPLDMENLGASIARAIGEQVAPPLGEIPAFDGAGIYALYYSGEHPAYRSLVEANLLSVADPHPIYVGKATVKGGRKGVATAELGSSLRSRLNQHARSVEQAENLLLEDFRARWLVLEHVWVSLGESVLIRRHSPAWNVIVDGFGNHDPGAGRHMGAKSRWDVLHPGRPWAARLEPSRETADQVAQDVAEFLAQRLH